MEWKDSPGAGLGLNGGTVQHQAVRELLGVVLGHVGEVGRIFALRWRNGSTASSCRRSRAGAVSATRSRHGRLTTLTTTSARRKLHLRLVVAAMALRTARVGCEHHGAGCGRWLGFCGCHATTCCSPPSSRTTARLSASSRRARFTPAAFFLSHPGCGVEG